MQLIPSQVERARWRRGALALLMLAAARGWADPAPAAAGPSPAEAPVWKPVGTWDSRGNYKPVASTVNFKKLHHLKDDPIPRYPVVLVHGLFGFDKLHMGPITIEYFVGVAKELRKAGIQVCVPVTKPFASFEYRAKQLKEQIEKTGWQKFNIIAHSAGGLDCRYMIDHLGMADKVVSLTTVSSPHYGVWYADWCLKWVMEKQRFWKVWDYFGLERQGIYDIGVKHMNEVFNPTTPDIPSIRYFSFCGSQPFFLAVPPLNGALLVNQICEKAAAGGKPSALERVMARSLGIPQAFMARVDQDPQGAMRDLLDGADPQAAAGPRAAETMGGWLKPELAGANDGLVTLSSGRWGEHLVNLKYDHLDEMGWLTFFQHKRFYRNITRMLADAGF